MYSLRSLVDGAELHQQPVQPAALHLLRQLVLLDITLGLQGVKLYVEAGPDHRHNFRHRAAVAVGQQVPAKSKVLVIMVFRDFGGQVSQVVQDNVPQVRRIVARYQLNTVLDLISLHGLETSAGQRQDQLAQCRQIVLLGKGSG